MSELIANLRDRGLGALSRLPAELRDAIHLELFHRLEAEALVWQDRTAASIMLPTVFLGRLHKKQCAGSTGHCHYPWHR